MTSRAARPFLPILRRLERELGIPVPARVRVLRELEYDLEELRRQLVAEGMSPDVARARSLEALVPDAATLGALSRLHTPWYRRVTAHLSQDRLRLYERSVLALLTVVVVLGATIVLLRGDLFRDPSPFLWPVLALGGVLLAGSIGQGFALWVKRDSRLPSEGPRALLALSLGTLGLGILGSLIDTLRFVMATGAPPSIWEPSGGEWAIREASLVSVALVFALGGALAWFALSQWLTLVAAARRDVLGLGHPTETNTLENRQ